MISAEMFLMLHNMLKAKMTITCMITQKLVSLFALLWKDILITWIWFETAYEESICLLRKVPFNIAVST